MDRDQISSSSDEFDSSNSNEQITSTNDSKECGGHDSEEVTGVKRRKIRIIDSESEAESETEENSKWVPCEEFEEVSATAQFISGESPTGSRVTSNTKEPADFFKLFFTEELIQRIVRETNNYAKRKLQGKTLSPNSIWRNWRDVQDEEFWAFVAVTINMGAMPLANLQEYWSKNNASYIPFYSETFARDRFAQIFWMLHLQTTSPQNPHPRTRLHRVSYFLDHINSAFLDYFTPGEQIFVNESTVKSRGRISFVSYPKKSTKWDIRVHTLSDSNTGYICCMLPYHKSLATELSARPDLPISTRIPIHLYKMLLDKIPNARGHHMFTNRYYTSYILAEELANLKCHLTGTILKNRHELPSQIREPKFSEKSSIAYRRGTALLLACRDKKTVVCLTTKGNTGMRTVKKFARGGEEIFVKKPNIVLNYTKYMGSLDRVDRYASMYCFLRKSLKWWRKLFFWGMEICLINSYVLYRAEKKKRNERPVEHSRYLRTLVEQLRGSYRQRRNQASTSIIDEPRLNGQLHVVLNGVKRDCKVCSNRSKPGGRRETSYFCDTCPDKPRMHLGECFVKYHTKTNYKQCDI